MNIPIVGDTLELTDLNVGGYPSPDIYYQWVRDGVGITGQTGTTYDVTIEDVGYTLGIKVTLTNFYGSVSRTINTDTLANQPSPYFNTPPLPSETDPIVGTTVFIENISVFGLPEPTLTFSWYLDNVLVLGATGATLETEELGVLRAVIDATNVWGSAGATIEFGTVLPSPGSSDWDTYRDGVYRMPSILTSEPRVVGLIEGPTDLPLVRSALIE